MATSKNSGLSVHQFGEIDWIDAALSPLFLIATLSMTGIVLLEIVPLKESLDMVIFQGNGALLTLDIVLGAAALLIAYSTNQVHYDDWNPEEAVVVGVVVVLHLGVAFIPIIRDLVTTNVYVGLFVTVINAAGYALIAYY
jgi:hypothetical protein